MKYEKKNKENLKKNNTLLKNKQWLIVNMYIMTNEQGSCVFNALKNLITSNQKNGVQKCRINSEILKVKQSIAYVFLRRKKMLKLIIDQVGI